MAENKKGSSYDGSKKYPAARRNTSSDSKKQGSSSGARKSKVAVKEKSSNYKEISAVILIAVCIFLAVSLFNTTGPAGRFVMSVFYGVFGGFGTVVLIICVFLYSICILRGNEKTVFNVKRCVLLSGLFLCGSALLHTAAGLYDLYLDGETNFFAVVSSLWTSVELHPLGGGLIGGAVSTLLQRSVAKVGTYVILIPATLIFAMLIFRFSILPVFKRVEKTAQKGWSGIVNVADRIKEKGKEKIARKEVERSKVVEAEYNVVSEPEDISSHRAGGSSAYNEAGNGDEVIEPNITGFENIQITYNIDEDGFFSFDSAEDNAEKKDLASDNKTDVSAVPENAGTSSSEENSENGGKLFDKNAEKPTEADKIAVSEEIAKIHKAPADNVDMPVLSKGEYANYVYPSENLLNGDMNSKRSPVAERAAATAVARKLEEVLKSFSIEAKVTHVSIGPTVTRYELLPSSGVRVNRIKNLSDDIALNLAAQSIRIEAPIPGKAAIGIEIPNKDVRPVHLKEIIQSSSFKNNKSKLTFCLGSDISGAPISVDLEKMPHLMIAGTTGSGKSVCTNCLITSLIYKASPDEVRFILVDPKIVEFSKYNGIPHLLLPVVTEPKKAAAALAWAVSEMEKRYRLFASNGVRDISSYNTFAEKNGYNKMPRIVILIDELADLMMVARDSVETAINRIAQKARAAGMHLVIATQRPSVDVITGLIKSNVPSRIALKVASPVDSRIILDTIGAEKLLGRGDMLYYPVGSMKTTRIQGAFVSDEEIERVVEFIKSGKVSEDGYIEEIIQSVNKAVENTDSAFAAGASAADDEDSLFKEAVKIAIQEKQISASYLQRMLKIGFNRAARMIDLMEEKGIIGCRDGNNPRKVLIDSYDDVN